MAPLQKSLQGSLKDVVPPCHQERDHNVHDDVRTGASFTTPRRLGFDAAMLVVWDLRRLDVKAVILEESGE